MINFIYILQGAGLLKIGTTTDLPSRIRALQSGSPIELMLIGYTEAPRKVEYAVHGRLEEHRQHGEWFSCSIEEAATTVLEEKRKEVGPDPRESAKEGTRAVQKLRAEGKELERGLRVAEKEYEKAEDRVVKAGEKVRVLNEKLEVAEKHVSDASRKFWNMQHRISQEHRELKKFRGFPRLEDVVL